MDYLQQLIKKIAFLAFLFIFIASLIAGAVVWLGLQYLPNLEPWLIALMALGITLVVSLIVAEIIAFVVTEPLRYIWQAILHVTPDHQNVGAPDLEKLKLGRELVTSLSLQVYQLASSQQETTQKASKPSQTNNQSVIANIPVPMFVMNKKQEIVYANHQAVNLLGIEPHDLVGRSLYEVLDFSFSDTKTYDAWLQECRNSRATDTKTWEHVKLTMPDQKTTKQLDLASYYNKDSTDNTETILCLFDKSREYSKVDDEIEFISLAVHELRTPLTMLRGYIELFEEELQGKLNPELTSYMTKMHASAQQLTAFVNNMLNVARVEENQLYLHLHEENWPETLTQAVGDMTLRAKARGYDIELSIQPGLPSVAVDKVSIFEVVNNLLDNAIKYSTTTKKIVVRSYLRDDGQIETTVQDFGIGIPGNIMGNLFQKFYRNHRSKAQVGGTGLGLYLSKAIIDAHGGQIWVKSKEGQGSVFGFTLQQYANLADELKSADNKDIRRTAHGWIKNHSFYRR